MAIPEQLSPCQHILLQQDLQQPWDAQSPWLRADGWFWRGVRKHEQGSGRTQLLLQSGLPWGTAGGSGRSRASGFCCKKVSKQRWVPEMLSCGTPPVQQRGASPMEPACPHLELYIWPSLHPPPSAGPNTGAELTPYLWGAGACAPSPQTSQQGGCQGSQHSARSHGTRSSHRSGDASGSHTPASREGGGAKSHGDLLLSLAEHHTPSHTSAQHGSLWEAKSQSQASAQTGRHKPVPNGVQHGTRSEQSHHKPARRKDIQGALNAIVEHLAGSSKCTDSFFCRLGSC